MAQEKIQPGQRFGKLVTLKRSCDGNWIAWTCVCDCGALDEILVEEKHLQYGEAIECGICWFKKTSFNRKIESKKNKQEVGDS